jgi:hypothetical protein
MPATRYQLGDRVRPGVAAIIGTLPEGEALIASADDKKGNTVFALTNKRAWIRSIATLKDLTRVNLTPIEFGPVTEAKAKSAASQWDLYLGVFCLVATLVAIIALRANPKAAGGSSVGAVIGVMTLFNYLQARANSKLTLKGKPLDKGKHESIELQIEACDADDATRLADHIVRMARVDMSPAGDAARQAALKPQRPSQSMSDVAEPPARAPQAANAETARKAAPRKPTGAALRRKPPEG